MACCGNKPRRHQGPPHTDADPRAYTDRLNEVVTASGWTRQYAVHTISSVIRLKKDKTIQTGKVLVTCTVTIAGIATEVKSVSEDLSCV